MQNHSRLIGLALLGPLLLWAGWPTLDWVIGLFVGFVPLLFIEEELHRRGGPRRRLHLLLYSYFYFLAWNLLTTYWVWNASPGGSIAAFLANSLLMTLPVMLYHLVRQTSFGRYNLYAFTAFWISLEYVHLNWDLSWPWLTLGNGFANHTMLVQWYEYSGVLGGSLWILAVNGALFSVIRRLRSEGFAPKKAARYASLPLALAVLPMILSLLLIPQTEVATSATRHAVAIQPNVDPYAEKFEKDAEEKILKRLIRLTRNSVDSTTALVLWPETSIPQFMDLDRLDRNPAIRSIQKLFEQYPNLHILAGASTYHMFGKDEEPTATARTVASTGKQYDVYNSALFLQKDVATDFYHKRKLVPGVEIMPYPEVFWFLEDFAIDLGGTSGSLGRSQEPSVFSVSDSVVVAPVICYESIYGDYLARFVRRGANLIAVITNDGWWGNTPGYHQHFAYARLRAIELRLPILRSANTGISGYISIDGSIVERTGWWEPGVVKVPLPLASSEMTHYARYGDYLGKIFLFLGIMFSLTTLVQYLKNRRQSYLNPRQKAPQHARLN